MTIIFGITGWKNTGKTTLVAALVTHFTAKGLRVSTIKHAHDGFDIDHAGTDSHHHRLAGASEVALISSRRWALMHEVDETDKPPTLEEIVAKLSPCDLVLVEGFKASKIPKIECVSNGSREKSPVWSENSSIVAVASDEVQPGCTKLVFSRDDVPAIADFILENAKAIG